ncbi:hypothetical protein AAFF_G00014230 [Aldrovandia affinis]|uniref:Laminin G domain-containing protein n=1 Tax=Aldrovandia affinis TaxID=143900 RepID=A0AAD7WI22_9TELE|nr:hypothetical protein AAFF_G00014230 [Aldrovandia affinis]
MNVTAPDLNFDGFLDDVDKTVSNLTVFLPPLLERLNRTEESSLLPLSSNVTESIKRVKELIQQARDAANRIPVPVDFSGDGHVELRSPTDLEDLKAYTNIALSLQRPITPIRGNRVRARRQKPAGPGNMFVLYLGNKNSSKDYIGMALRDNVLYCVYKLGGSERQIKASAITESSPEQAFFDRVNFRRDNIINPPFKGCMTNIKLGSDIVKFEEELGVGRGCSSQLLAIRESTFSVGGSLSALPRGFELTGNVTVSLGFRSTQNEAVLLRNSQGGSSIVACAFFRLEMRVDEEDMGQAQSPSSLVPAPGQDILLGTAFQGCLTNLYMRRPNALYQPEDLSAFNSSGDVFLGFCVAERPPQALLIKRDHGRSVGKGDVWQGDGVSGCSLPSPVKYAHHLGGPTSHLSYNITPQVLNHRPHFSLAFRTRSADGMLLFVCSKPGHSHVVLYLSKGNIKLAVGGNQPIVHKEKYNDDKWHKVMFSLEMNTFHLVVDDLRAMDGVLLSTNGSSLDLKPPVYLGSVPQSTYTESQTIFPRESLVGCVRNFKMNSQRIEEPSANHRAPPCFNGNREGGAYFSGNGGYVVLEYSNLGVGFHLEFEVQPRNLTGILLHIGDPHRPHLTLFMQKGEVVLQLSGAAGESSMSVAQRGLCDGLFHRVTVDRRNNHVQLAVDKKSEGTRVPNSTFFGITAGHHLYAGGVPGTLQHKKLPIKSSFIGCIRNLRINRKPLSFGEASQVFGPVNLQECPVS